MYIDLKRIILLFLCIFNCINWAQFLNVENNNIIHLINSIPKNSWKAVLNLNFLKNMSHIMGVLHRNKLSSSDFLPINDIPNQKYLPEYYDITLKWPECKSIVTIRDQSNCGSCWALSTASAFGDRLCIASNESINKVLSGEYINSCCTGKCGDGCNGGHPEKAWKYIKKKGLCTGGEYASNEGCQPYSIAPCPRNVSYCLNTNENTPQCSKNQCTNYNYEISFSSDLYYATKVYSVKPNMEAIMNDIYKNGPVVAAMKVYEDFLHYKSDDIGSCNENVLLSKDSVSQSYFWANVLVDNCVINRSIYRYITGAVQGDHAVKLLGWGRDDGIDYWLCANTWGTSWGMDGMFKIQRGNNECGIEDRITGGLPKV